MPYTKTQKTKLDQLCTPYSDYGSDIPKPGDRGDLAATISGHDIPDGQKDNFPGEAGPRPTLFQIADAPKMNATFEDAIDERGRRNMTLKTK